jgi:hypothetical protein
LLRGDDFGDDFDGFDDFLRKVDEIAKDCFGVMDLVRLGDSEGSICGSPSGEKTVRICNDCVVLVKRLQHSLPAESNQLAFDYNRMTS